MKLNDLVINLYDNNLEKEIKVLDDTISVYRVLSPQSHLVIDFIETNFSKGWSSEAKAALYKNHPTCFVAVKEREILGFACYDATAKGYFGPIGIKNEFRGLNVGQRLLQECLKALKNDGYGYAIIGSVGDIVVPFYKKHFNLHIIERTNSIYNRMF